MILGSNFFNSGTSFPSPMGTGNDGDLFWRTDQKTLYYWDNLSGAWITMPGVPVGAIIAWHNYSGTLSLPANFVQCNGQQIFDLESPLNTQFVPDLNNFSSGTNRFLRGATTSGTLNSANLPTHSHNLSGSSAGITAVAHSHVEQRNITAGSGSTTLSTTTAATSGTMANYHSGSGTTDTTAANTAGSTSGPDRAADGTTRNEPASMNVIWVMRIK